MLDSSTRFVETLCHECVVRVLWFFGDPDPRGNHIDISLISSHGQWWQGRWRNRIKNAWAVLRNRYDWSGFQVHSREEGVALRDILIQAIDEAWPPPPAEGVDVQ